MPQPQKLSDLVNEIDLTIRNRFGGNIFWITAEITDVKKQPAKQWCFLKFIEKEGANITTELKGVFWSNAYHNIVAFERETQQAFTSGLQITCAVRVRFHKRYGIDLEVQEIDFAYAVGKLELERKHTLERLVNENPSIQLLADGRYLTINKQLPLPGVFKSIALITAPNSDGYRDFTNIIQQNKYGYAFTIHAFLTTIQGDSAAQLIIQQLRNILESPLHFDVVVIVRGGGSDIDFKSFNEYELARVTAHFPIPIFTGIGHDRNTSIVDLMARQLKTPTDAAGVIIDNNMAFEREIDNLKERFHTGVKNLLSDAATALTNYKQRVKNLHPDTILNKGFAMVKHNGNIESDGSSILPGATIDVVFKENTLQSTVTKNSANDKQVNF